MSEKLRERAPAPRRNRVEPCRRFPAARQVAADRVILGRAGLSLLAVLLAGCAVGPDYRKPDLPAPAAWRSPMQGGLQSASAEATQLARWWEGLNDPQLSRLIEAAAASNLDLKLAQARLRESRARRGVSAADRFPTLNTRAGANRSRSSEEMGLAGGKIGETYSAQFDASWELDIFGGKRRALEAAEANVDAAIEDTRDVQVSLLAEVALNYIELRADQARLAIAQENLATQTETWQIARWRFDAGLTTQLDEDQAKLNLEQTRAQLPALTSALEQAKNRLAVLLGKRPGELAQLDAPAPLPPIPASVAVGIPADTLRSRPDLRRAERQLAAATAQVGMASAALYPNFSLSGTLGLQALSSGNLLTASARLWSVAANAGWVLFDAGRIRQNIEVQNALQEQALIRYESAVLAALRDVENALVAYAEEQNRRTALDDAVQAAQSAAALAASQYAAGLTDFQSVLDTQRSLLTLQDQLAQSDAAVASNLARLYKALGGGWHNEVSGEKS
jgi:NodT family efflux transporter outer membrane factor (OMF) lipoprotein